MKIIPIAFVVIISFLSFSFAQKKEKNYKWGCAFAINSVEAQIGVPLQSSWGGALADLNVFGDKTNNSISLSIIPRYFITHDLLLRFDICITNLQFIYHQEIINSLSHSIRDEILKQKIYSYKSGIEWSYLKKENISFYCGAVICFIHYDDMNYSGNGEYRQMPTDTLLSWASNNVNYPGGFADGIGAFTGFSIYLVKHISFGAEFSSLLLYYKIGGANNYKQTIQNLPSPPLTSEETTESNLYKGFQFSKILSSFNISVWF